MYKCYYCGVKESSNPSLTVMHLPYLVKLDGTTPSVFLFDIFVFLCFRLIESIEINDMIDLLPKVLKSLEDVGQKESFLKFMGLIASGTFPLHSICYLLFLDIVEWFSCDSKSFPSFWLLFGV
jgi:hypothetical protein